MTIQHNALTGSDLHEPKGVASTSVGNVYAADGTGSGVWKKLGTASLDASSVKNLNKVKYTFTLTDISTPKTFYFPISDACVVTKITTVIGGAITTADTILTMKNGVTTMGTMTIAFTGSAGGRVQGANIAANNTFAANTYLVIDCDGGSTGTTDLTFVLDCTLT